MPPARSAPRRVQERDPQRRLKLYEVVLKWTEVIHPFPPTCGYTAAHHDPSLRSKEHNQGYYIAASTEQEAEGQVLNTFREELKRSKGDLGYILKRELEDQSRLLLYRPKKVVVRVQEVQVKGYQISLEKIVEKGNHLSETDRKMREKYKYGIVRHLDK